MTTRRRLGIVLAVVTVIVVVLAVRLSEVTTIDQDGPPIPDWLPPETTGLHVRGWSSGCGFSGRCPSAAWTAWTGLRGLRLRERRHGTLSWDDYGAQPVATFSVAPPSARAVRREVGEGEELVFGDGEDWPGDQPYLRIHYLPASGILYGNRIDP